MCSVFKNVKHRKKKNKMCTLPIGLFKSYRNSFIKFQLVILCVQRVECSLLVPDLHDNFSLPFSRFLVIYSIFRFELRMNKKKKIGGPTMITNYKMFSQPKIYIRRHFEFRYEDLRPLSEKKIPK